MLQVTREYKEAMAAENVDWETSVSKYGDVHERYRDVYPSPEQAQAMGKEYPHQKDEITKGESSELGIVSTFVHILSGELQKR